MSKEIFLILHNIRSAHNVGAIFRTADAAGVKQIFLIGYTPTPRDRFGRKAKEMAKTALGAEETVEWQWSKTLSPVVKKLREQKVQLLALEQDAKSIDYKKAKPAGSFALVLGNEVSGLPQSVLKQCDEIIEVPMRGSKESLNVSVAAGVALFRLAGI